MATGLIAWTCLLLAAGTPDEVYYTNFRGFQIPIKIKPASKAEVTELLLYVSRDQGRTWEHTNSAKSDREYFDFEARTDGLLYFTVAVKDRLGKQDPPDVRKAQVGLKVYVDTVKPAVRFSGERVNDDILVSWDIQEENPDPASLKLQYRAATGAPGAWTPLPIDSGLRGNSRVRCPINGDVTLRLSLKDRAGNEGAEERTIAGSAGAPRPTGPTDRGTAASGLITTSATDPLPPIPPPSTMTPPPVPGTNTIGRSVSEPRTPGSPAPAYSPAPTSHAPVPPVQIVNQKEVKLGFEVPRVGPSGLGSVEVFVTTNQGTTWEKMDGTPAVTLPGAADFRGGSPHSGSVTVPLPKEGVTYGFHLVVKSRAGLGKPGPKPGDAPQVLVEADTTQPYAELHLPQPHKDQRDILVLTWKATDRNLAANPVTLEWSEEGRNWSPIGEAQLPNTGEYPWQVPAKIPPRVHLRLTVRDTAGNVAVAQTDQPVLIDLLEPEVINVKVAVK